jgi:hypothetical protein
MGLNRMMMRNGVKVEDGSKFWSFKEADNTTIAFTVPPGIKRIKVFAEVDDAPGEPFASSDASIKNTINNKYWGQGYSEANDGGDIEYHQNIDSVVGVTPNKTYTLHFDCYYTSGVTFSWGKAINDMTPTVEDY